MRAIVAILLCLSAFLTQARTNVLYVSQNGSGTQSGSDINDCRTLAWVNAATVNGPVNWGTGANQIGPGTTINLVGTLTNTLSAYGSGTAANPITIYFESNAMFSAPTLPANSIWINIGGLSNIVIDGGVNGLIQLTDNGTVIANGGTCDYGNANVGGISANPINNVIIENLTISNMYNRQTNTEPPQGAFNEDGYAILWGGSGLTISNCFITGCQDGISGIYGNPANSNLTVIGCTLSNYNHGVTVGTGGITNPLFYNVSITHNIFQGGDMFEQPDGVDMGLHRNPIFIFNESPDRSGCVSNILIAYNFIKHGFRPQSHAAGTAAMFFDLYNNTMANHIRIFNNISTLTAPLSWFGGGGFISECGTDVLVANNTASTWLTNGAAGGSGQISGAGTNVYLYNNICVSQWGVVLATYANTNGLTNNIQTAATLFGGVWSDYNIYNGQQASSFQEYIYVANSNALIWQTGLANALSEWTNLYSGAFQAHFDPHSFATPMQMDSNFIPLSTDTVAVGNGTNLTSWGITNDFAGNPRPATGNWTIGAYQITDPTGSNILSGITNVIINAAAGGSGIAAGISNFVASSAGDITNGLLLQYPLNQSSGTTARDSSGNGYTGTLTGNAVWTNGLAGTRAVSFPSNNGSSASPDGVSPSSISYTGDWTETFWVYNNSFPGVYNYAASTASGTGTFVGPSTWGFYDGSTLLSGSQTLSSGAWYFIAVSKSAGTNYQLYLNGGANGAGALANVNISYLVVGNRNNVFLGMNGSVEDFRIFNRVLSGVEISTLAANGPDDVAATILAPPQNLHVVP